MKKISIDQYLEEWSSPPDFFICSASYEDRCKAIPLLWKNNQPGKTILFYTNTGRKATANKRVIESTFPGIHVAEQLSLHAPLKSADKIVKALSGIIKYQSGRLLLDATTFTREQLLILVKYIDYLKKRNETSVSVDAVYTCAQAYSVNTAKNNLWLSRGVLEVRPVVGYSGSFSIGKPNQLIMLVGFEHERAKAVIEHIEPSSLYLGVGAKLKSISEELADTNQDSFKKLKEFVRSIGAIYSDVQDFEFSCVDPWATAQKILEVARFDSHNVIVCPMNTKISTLGVALAAFARPEIQVVYAEPQRYNENGYSIPDSNVRCGQIWSTINKEVKQPLELLAAHDAGNLPA